MQFVTNKENLKAGQIIRIKDPARGLDDDFLIQKLSIKSKGTDFYNTSVVAASTLFGYIEFFQLLFSKTARGLIDVNEIVDIVINVDETIKIEDNYIFTQKTPPFYAMGPTQNETPNDAYADFSEAY